MAFQIRKATLADVPAMCEIYLSAFSEDTLSLQVFPRTSNSGRSFWLAAIAEELQDRHAHFLVTTTPDAAAAAAAAPASTVIAFAKWASPGTPISAPPPAAAFPADGNPTLAVHFFSALTDAHNRIMGHSPHWYLEIVAVSRAWMGKGASSSLMRWGVTRADEDGVPCFLEASETALPVYEKYGFRVLSSFALDTPGGRLEEFFMMRDAQSLLV